MDSFRIFAGMVFAIAVFLLVDAWVKEHNKAPAIPATPSASRPDTAPPIPSSLGTPATPAASSKGAEGRVVRGERVRVATDMFVAEIDTNGGDLRRVELTKYRDTFDRQKNFVLLEETPD